MKKIHSFDVVHDGQKMFRLILDAMSSPLQKVNIKEYAEKLYGNNKYFLGIGFTLLDNETTFYTFDNQILDENIISLTLSGKEVCEKADFIFVENEANLEKAVKTAKCGTLENPHQSATIVVKLREGKTTELTMAGPGIDGRITLKTSAMADRAVSLRDQMYFEYPQGLDFIFVDDAGDVFAIPRLVKKEEK